MKKFEDILLSFFTLLVKGDYNNEYIAKCLLKLIDTICVYEEQHEKANK